MGKCPVLKERSNIEETVKTRINARKHQKQLETMPLKNNPSCSALAGPSLLLASPARAQFVYNNEDALLDFRNTTVSSDSGT